MTQLQEMLDAGMTIQISEYVAVDTFFTDSGEPETRVFHPLNYSYLAYDDPFVAHRHNMQWINNHIQEMADNAIGRLDRMVDEMNRKGLPVMVQFFSPVTVTEDEDGVFDFVFGTEAGGLPPSNVEKLETTRSFSDSVISTAPIHTKEDD